MQAKLGPADRSTVSDYLDVLREVERRIQQTEAKNAESPLPEYERPGIGVPERFDDHAKLMFDLQRLAFQGDITRVTTFMYGGEQRARMYPEIGLERDRTTRCRTTATTPRTWRSTRSCAPGTSQLFAYLVEKMRATPDGDGNLLDHSLLMIGGGMSNGNIHSHMDVPIALVGGAGGFKGNRHVATPMGTPLSNLLVTIVNSAGRAARRASATAPACSISTHVGRRPHRSSARQACRPGVTLNACERRRRIVKRVVAGRGRCSLAAPIGVAAAGSRRRSSRPSKSGDVAAVRALLKQPDVGQRRRSRRHDAAALGDRPRRSRDGELLVAAGANVKATNRYGVTPLYSAARQRQRGDDRAAAQRRRRCRDGAARRRDGADDRGAHRQGRRGARCCWRTAPTSTPRRSGSSRPR